jgi:hypothetical protein
MRRQTSHLAPHRSWISQPAFPPLRGGEPTVLVRQRPRMSATFTSTRCRKMILRITPLQPHVVASSPTRSKSRKWRRPQCPGNRYALARVSYVPWQFTLENCQLPPASPQSSFGKSLRFATFSLNPLCGRMSRPATEKQFPLVQKLWTGRLPCGSLRKSPHESRHDKCGLRHFSIT